MRRTFSTFLIALAASSAVAADSAAPEVAYPTGYRDWHHVKSMAITPGHALFDMFGGLHHIYANKPAVAGYATGKFPDGAVIVFDLLDAKTADNTVQEGARKLVGVMRKDAKAYAETGGWGFEGFKGDSRTERLVTQKNAPEKCFPCHSGQEKTGFVYSALRP